MPVADSLDGRAPRNGGRRDIPWDHVDSADEHLDAAGHARVGAAWRARMRQEHLAVGAFSLVATELAREGCDTVVLAMITRAASDEVRHADVCRRLAERHLGASAMPRRVRGVPSIPAHEGLSDSDRVLLHVVEMCCLSETLTGVYLTEMLARHPPGRARRGRVPARGRDRSRACRVGLPRDAAARRNRRRAERGASRDARSYRRARARCAER